MDSKGLCNNLKILSHKFILIAGTNNSIFTVCQDKTDHPRAIA